jgi:transposase
MAENENKNGRHPETEVEPRAERRHYTSEYKQRILTEIDRAREPGEAGAILRREGLYSQIISKWRQKRESGGLADTKEAKRGPKEEAGAGEIARLQHENEQLRTRLERAELIIEVQKKVSLLLGLEESGRKEAK